MRTRMAIGVSCTLALASGCLAEELDTEERASALITHNALTFNMLAFNAMTYNALTFNALAMNGMNLGNGLDLADPDTHLFVTYLVECALPADAAVTIQGEAFTGALGLAPAWADAACDEGCQRWVSACLLARVNARGERVAISMRGPDPALHPAPGELGAFPAEEGTYFGNLFADPARIYAASTRDDLALPRSCGDAVADCPIEIVGRSPDVCATGSVAQGRRECRDPSGTAWHEAITVYLP